MNERCVTSQFVDHVYTLRCKKRTWWRLRVAYDGQAPIFSDLCGGWHQQDGRTYENWRRKAFDHPIGINYKHAKWRQL